MKYTFIDEPFSPPGTCNDSGTTTEMTNCVLEQIVDVDSTVNTLQQSRFERASSADKPGMLKEYARWATNRTARCKAGADADSGGSLDQVNAATCMLHTSQDRVETLNNVG
jgi:uncharacterized protein YecT (DUF1311 family)